INNVIDTAGAGDWCTAGIISTLFSKNASVENLRETNILSALRFGQALSAINCTFEGARGSMYNITFKDLSLMVKDILKTKSNFISLKSYPYMKLKAVTRPIKISSLFVHTSK